MLYLGIDAGGTKTQFALCDEHGHILALHRCEGISFGALGAEGMKAALAAHTLHILDSQNASLSDVAAVCFGVPCLGENREDDIAIDALTKEVFAAIPLVLVNDAEVAWAGSFALTPGINLVAGTGCIAFGRDAHGNTARSGGWHHLFSDEGSGYWLGRRTLELFCKQADQRVERGPLYNIIRTHFSLEDDFDMIPIAENHIFPKRDTVASMQLLLCKAAEEGDLTARKAYEEAAQEIAQNVRGIIGQLRFALPVPISCSGGIFKVGNMLTEPFEEAVKQAGCTLVKPKAEPWCGALMLALNACGNATTEALERLIDENAKGETICL